MPELPDIQVYLAALDSRVAGRVLEATRIRSPFLLRSIDPPLERFHGRAVIRLGRLGKRIVFEFGEENFLVLHLMIAGRLHWKKKGARLHGKIGLAAFDFPNGSLHLTEAGSKRRASLYAVHGIQQLQHHDRGGLDVLACSRKEFRQRLVRGNHTLKRTLCDPALFDGIGNAYSDEILHAAQLSPLKLTARLSPEEIDRLFRATRETLGLWTQRLLDQIGSDFPEKVTAFRPEMAVHGKYRKPCPRCGSQVQRIVYKANETHYCATCQTGGKVLKDRALSRLLKSDWPSSIDDLEEKRR